jgi:hypothetical protein
VLRAIRDLHQPTTREEVNLHPRDRRFFPSCITCGKPAPIGKRKCVRCLKGKLKVTTGRPVTKGSNARGIAAHKPDRSRTRKAKRQNPPQGGPRDVTAYHFNPARADRKPNEEVW